MPWNDTRRRAAQRARDAIGNHTDADPEFADLKRRFTKMHRDMNDLGAGFYETLVDTKSCMSTSYEAASVLDKFYNGSFADPWPEIEGGTKMKLHGIMGRYKAVRDDGGGDARA